jgi:nucleoside-diphosphate-sugar epimerase
MEEPERAQEEDGGVIAFVAGSTGYTGREVVRALRARGIETVAHVRPDSPRLADWRARFESLGARIDTTPWEPAAMAARLAVLRPDYVFALLGTTRARARRARAAGGRDEGYEAVDYGLTMLLLRAAAGAGSRPRFVYLSSAGARDGSGNAYLGARARVEGALREGALPYTVARPSFITGPDRDEFRAGERVLSWLVDGVLAAAALFGGTRLRARFRSTTNVALAESLVRLALDPALAGKVVESEGLQG